MSQRNSGKKRVERDLYETPAWVTDALTAELVCPKRMPRGSTIWECAAGNGAMVHRLEAAGLNLVCSDIEPGNLNWIRANFLEPVLPFDFAGIWSNPPYKHADAFVRRALELTERTRGMVAMLLKVDFDSGKTRTDIFENHPAWGLKIVLTDRITWFDPEPGQSTPSENHAWFVWDWKGGLGRSIAYAGCPADELARLAALRKVRHG